MIALLFLIAFTSVDCRSNRQEIEISNEDGNRIADEKSHGRNLTSPESAVNGVLNVLVGDENRTLIGNGRLRINTKRNALKEINGKPIVVVFHEDKTLDGIEEQGKIFEEMKNITQQEKYNGSILLVKFQDLCENFLGVYMLSSMSSGSLTILATNEQYEVTRHNIEPYNKEEFLEKLKEFYEEYAKGNFTDKWECNWGVLLQ
ncbi:hypothetical protein ACOME3_000423 [Neoechinorhynchus agilis]